ncbi:DUF6531 domain-containing protein [Cognataquiflexum rubidum]|uniref:DUF6531 domain-containing protein n=1 Tax=Cognataquiflexum rubidum TaxID=2922273 RepID=UPI001F13A5D1|nr:DUF6531 domain-containing protein [Cognataquiflexum rubidum]MCH6234195.1 DUF6531 domain-containing protein [Cognataquiflexum rubidum]
MPEVINRNQKIAIAAQRAKEQRGEDSESGEKKSTVGQIIDGANTALGAYGDVMGFTNNLSEKALLPVLQQLSFIQGIACLPASSHMDPVTGIDVHLVMIPPSPSPIPMPHPYLAMIMDPKDWLSCAVMTVAAMAAPVPTGNEDADAAASLAFNVGTMALGMTGMDATVKLGGFTPRTTSGVKNKTIPHFPMGASFAPLPVKKNSGHAQFGSLFLNADSNPFTGMMHLNNDCWDIGLMQLKRKQYSPEPGSFFMPTGFVMAIPSHNVIVNPVPTPVNPVAAVTKLLNAGFAKVLHGATNKMVKGNRSNNAIHKAICHVTGHPVDVVSGMFFTDEEDFSLPGVIPISWERSWFSDSEYDGPLGRGWHHEYDMGFRIDVVNRAILRLNDGRLAVFDNPSPGKFSFNREEKLFLHADENGTYYIVDSEGLHYRFTEKAFGKTKSDEEHLLQSISDRAGYAIRFIYNRLGNLIRIIDSAGRELLVSNDMVGRITKILAPHPELEGELFPIAQYTYSDEGDMIVQTDALGQQMLFEYNNHMMVKETWRDGQEWHFVYEKPITGSRCIETWGEDDLYHHKLKYYEGLTEVEDSLGYLTQYYHKDGLPYKKTDANGNDWLYRYNKYHELEWETDPLGNQHATAYDKWGNVCNTTDPCGGFTHAEYFHPDFRQLPTEAMDKSGGIWNWHYDEKGRVTKLTNPLKAVSRYKYDDGLMVRFMAASGAETEFQYDNHQNLIGILDGNGANTLFQFDRLGNCIGVTNPKGAKQNIMFDLKGRATKIHDYDGNVIHLEYDGLDNVIRYKDKQKEVNYTYKGLWNLTSRTESGATFFFNYDTEERLQKLVNEHGHPYRFTLDPVGNVLEEVGFDGITRNFERNASGWVTRIKRPNNKFTLNTHDPCGRITEVNYSDGTKENYTYHPDGSLLLAVNDAAHVAFERDIMGNTIKESVNGEWVASEYDAMGNRLTIQSSLGAAISHQFNTYGDLLQMESKGWKAQLKHDAMGMEVERRLPGSIISQWQHDLIGRPLQQGIGILQGDEIYLKKKREYLWEVNDRLKQIKDDKGITEFDHDGWSNLAKTTYPDGEVQWRNPDAVGNLFRTVDRGDRRYGRGGQLKKSNGWEYAYDGEGNLIEKKHISGERWEYEWNDAGMLVLVIRPDKEAVYFSYDVLGRRLTKQFKNTITKFIWDGNVPLHEWKEHALSGQKLSNLKVGENGLITWLFDSDSFVPAGKIKGEKIFSIISDHLGTPSQMYKEDGTLFWESELDSYGKVRMGKGEMGFCPFRYQGQYQDIETGLCYNRFRYYAVEEGRYLSQDPLGIEGGVHLYIYVHDPCIWIDELGLLERPFIRKATREKIEKKGKVKNGRFIDANTRKPIPGGQRRDYSRAKGMYDIGHKKGHEHWRLVKIAEKRGYSQTKFNAWINKNPQWFQVEDPKENQSHRHEKKRKTSYSK